MKEAEEGTRRRKRVSFVSETATANGNRSSRAGGVASDSNADTPVGLGAPSLFLQMSSSDASTIRRYQTRSAADDDETGRATGTGLKEFGLSRTMGRIDSTRPVG